MNQSVESLRQTILNSIAFALRQNGRQLPAEIHDAMLLADELRIDSLDLAVMVVELERQTGVDPFREWRGPIRTFGDLVTIYSRAVKVDENSGKR